MKRTAAKREASGALDPSRQVTLRHAFLPKLRAKSLTETGLCSSLRCTLQGRRRLPLHGLGGKDAYPGYALVVDWMSAT